MSNAYIPENLKAAVSSVLEVLALTPGSLEAERALWKAQWELFRQGFFDSFWTLTASNPTLTIRSSQRLLSFYIQAPEDDLQKWLNYWTCPAQYIMCPLEVCAEMKLPLSLMVTRRIDAGSATVLFRHVSMSDEDDVEFDVSQDHQRLPLCLAVDRCDIEGIRAFLRNGASCPAVAWHRWSHQVGRVADGDHRGLLKLSEVAGALLESTSPKEAMHWLGETKGWLATPAVVEPLKKVLSGWLEKPFLMSPFVVKSDFRITPLQYAYVRCHFTLLEGLALAGAKADVVVEGSALGNWTLERAVSGQYKPLQGDDLFSAHFALNEETGYPRQWTEEGAVRIRQLVNAKHRSNRLEKTLADQGSPGSRKGVRF